MSRKLHVNPNSELFSPCSPIRVEQIQGFVDVLTEHCGVRIVIETKQYSRLDCYSENPRWIRLYPMPSRDAFVAAFFIEKPKLERFIQSAQENGLYAEEGRQQKSKDTDRLRLHIPDGFDVSAQSFIDFLNILLKSYEKVR